MTGRGLAVRWFLLAVVVGIVLVWAEAQSSGGLAGLLRVGDESVARPIVEEELGSVPLTEGFGHDGQFFYAIGIDLSGDIMSERAGDWAYRYRRILYPLVASGFGLLEGEALLFGMVATSILSFAVAAAAAAWIANRVGLSEWVVLAVLINPGIWLAVRLLTADTLALALMLLGLGMVVARRRGSPAGFALSVLAKEVYLPTPAGVAVDRDRRRWLDFLVPLAVLLAWLIWLSSTMTSGFTPRNNIALPATGVIEAASNWASMGSADWFYLILAFVFVAAGVGAGALMKGWLRWPILAWVGVALISSEAVWEFGNNAARVFAPIAVLIALNAVRVRTETVEDGPANPRPAP